MGNDSGQILELMLIDFNHAQALVIVLINQRLDAAGFARAAVAKEQHIVGRTSLYKGFRVLTQCPLLALVANKVVKGDELGVGNRHQLHLAAPMVNAKGLVQAQLAHAISTVKCGHQSIKSFYSSCLLQLLAQSLHLFADIFVKACFLFRHCLIIGDNIEAVDAQLLFQGSEIILKQGLENGKIIHGQGVDTALASALLLAGNGKGSLHAHQKISQIIMPQIFVKAINSSNIQQLVDLVINLTNAFFLVIATAFHLSTHLR